MLSDWGRSGFGLSPNCRRPAQRETKVMRYGIPEPRPEVATIRVLMQRTTKAIPFPGSFEVTYQAGCEYDLPEWLAEAFFKGGEADPAEAHQQPSQAAQDGPGAAGEASGPVLAPGVAKSRPRRRQAP
jgi:hypothetical protein